MVKWRVIKSHLETPFMNAALDEALVESVANGGPPTIRMWGWTNDAVVIGCFQKMHDEINVEKCKELGMDCTRRMTGGGAMYLNKDKELTYSVVAPEHLIPNDVHKAYELVSSWAVDGLRKMGITGEFKPINDVIVGGKKISGGAMTFRKGAVMVHGTLLYDLNLRDMFGVLKVGQDKISDKMIEVAEQRVTSIARHVQIDRDAARDALMQGLIGDKEHEFGKWTKEEFERAKELVASKYAKEEWIFKR